MKYLWQTSVEKTAVLEDKAENKRDNFHKEAQIGMSQFQDSVKEIKKTFK